MPEQVPIIGQKGIEEKETVTLYLSDPVVYNGKVYRAGFFGTQITVDDPKRVEFSCEKIVFDLQTPPKK